MAFSSRSFGIVLRTRCIINCSRRRFKFESHRDKLITNNGGKLKTPLLVRMNPISFNSVHQQDGTLQHLLMGIMLPRSMTKVA